MPAFLQSAFDMLAGERELFCCPHLHQNGADSHPAQVGPRPFIIAVASDQGKVCLLLVPHYRAVIRLDQLIRDHLVGVAIPGVV